MMNGATAAALKEMERGIMYVIGMKNYSLKIEPEDIENDEWKLLGNVTENGLETKTIANL